MDSMEIIKVIAVHGLSVNSLWTVKTEFGCVYCQNRICGIRGMSVESVESTWITWGSDKSSILGVLACLRCSGDVSSLEPRFPTLSRKPVTLEWAFGP
jgi:hypothetical protein